MTAKQDGGHTPGPPLTRRFHIISITLRRAVGDHAYHLRDSFYATLEEACQRHIAFHVPGVRCSVLRDGSTGHRYSVEASRDIARAAAFEAAHLAKLRSIAAARGES